MTIHQISGCGMSEQNYEHTCLSTLAFISSFFPGSIHLFYNKIVKVHKVISI